MSKATAMFTVLVCCTLAVAAYMVTAERPAGPGASLVASMEASR